MDCEKTEHTGSPLVSVLVLAYNQQDYIAETLDSIVSQKVDFPIEVLVGEDCSTDNTREILKRYEQNYPFVRVIYQAKNLKLIKNYDSVMRQCRGKYIAVCGGDDYWTDSLKLQKQADFLETHPDCGLVYCEIDRLHQETGAVEKRFFSNRKKGIEHTFEYFLVHAPFLAPCTWLLRAELLEPFGPREMGYVAEDLHILLLISSKAKVWFMDESMAMYRVLTESISHIIRAKGVRDYQKEILKIQTDWAQRKDVSKALAEKLMTHYYSSNFSLMCCSGDDQVCEAYRFLYKAQKVTSKFRVMYLCSKFRFGRYFLQRYYFLRGIRYIYE